MLFGAVSVLVVLATGDPGDGSSRAIDLALRTALVRDATVAVRAAEPNASDEQLEAMGTAAHASLLGVVSWSEHERRVVIRFTKLPYGGWADREVRFDAADAASERGRTVGFALASMMPADAFEEPAAAAPAAAPPLASVASVAWPAPAAPPVIEDRAASAPPRSNPLALDAAALAVAAPGGYGGGVGGTFAVRLPLVGALGARAAASARAESVGPAQASARAVVGGAGLAWQPWLDDGRRWGLGARVDLLLVYVDVAHLSEDDARAAHLSRVMGGVDAALEGTLRFSDHASVVGALGTEVAMGRTDLYVRERRVASFEPVKLTLELGIRAFFR